jgi:UDP-hydrolysing UDP-N-acetyl-D-glucosamine 2-epimerase
MHRIAVFTGSRADWGLLSMPARALRNAGFGVIVIATGQHSLPSGTVGQVKADGFLDVRLVPMELSKDDGASLAVANGLMQAQLAPTLAEIAADMLVILGDRYEALGAAMAATLLSLPVAHIAGGDITEGAIDDAMRHAITKLSHLHFVTNEQARYRLISMGEQPDHVIVSGSPGIDRLYAEREMKRGPFFTQVGLKPGKTNALVTFHPETHAADRDEQVDELLKALSWHNDDFKILFTGVNADPGYRAVAERITRFVAGRDNAVLHVSLGSALYANALRHCDIVIGNSSSGLYEAPTFRKPTVNIGDRQKGRLRAASVIDTPANATAISKAIEHALAGDWRHTKNPYGDGHAAERITATLAALDDPRKLLRKRFFEGMTA